MDFRPVVKLVPLSSSINSRSVEQERNFVCVSVYIFTDVGMMMMQTGMVKQSNTYRSIDGTDSIELTPNTVTVLDFLASTNNRSKLL